MPTVVTQSIGTTGRDHPTLASWESDTDENLTVTDEQHDGEVYADSTFTAGIFCSGATTDATRYRRLVAAAGHYYDPTDDTGAKVSTGAGAAFFLEKFFRVEGIGHYGNGTNAASFFVNAEGIIVDRCYSNIGVVNGTGKSIQASYSLGSTRPIVRNCTFVIADGTSAHIAINAIGTLSIDVYNVSVYSPNSNGTTTGVSSTGPDIENMRNVVVAGADTDYILGVQGGATWTHNTSSDGTAPGTDAQTSNSAANNWVDSANGDFTPQNDILDSGVDLSGTFTDDFYGTDRGTGSWDRGSVEAVVLTQTVIPTFIASGSAVSAPAVTSVVSVVPTAIPSGSVVYAPTVSPIALDQSIRELVIDDLVDAISGVASVLEVTRREVNLRKLAKPAVMVVEPDEDKDYALVGLYQVSARIPVRIFVEDEGDDPHERLDAVRNAVEIAILADRRRGGNAIDTTIRNTAGEVTSVTDLLVMTIDVDVIYRHSAKDPTSKVPSY